MIETQRLLGKVNYSVRKNLGKEIIALLLVFLSSVVLAPLALAFASLGSLPVAFGFLLLIPILLFMLQISFAQMCGKMYREEPCVLGNLLDSFRDWQRCGSLALTYALSSIVICSAVVFGGTVISLNTAGFDINNFDQEAAVATMFSFFPALVMLCMVIFFLAVLLPTSLTHLVLMDKKNISIVEALRENSRLLKGRKIQLLVFLLKTGGWWLVGATISLVGSFVLVSAMFKQPESAQNTLAIMNIASQVCDMVYYICVYTSLIRLVTGVAAFYQAVRDKDARVETPLQIHQEATTEDTLPSTEEL